MAKARPRRRDAPPAGYRLATAEILYRMPDHPHVLQTYVWQGYDLAPRFPVLHEFLRFWQRELDGALHSVRVASKSPASKHRLRHVDLSLSVH